MLTTKPAESFNNIPIPIVTLGPGRIVLSVNHAGQTAFGSGLVTGASWEDFLADCQVPSNVVELLRAAATTIPLKLRDNYGEPWPCEIVAHQLESSPLTVIMCWPAPAPKPAAASDPEHKLDAINNAALHLANTFNNHLTAITGILQSMQGHQTLSPNHLDEVLRVTRQAAVVVGDLQRTVRPPPPRFGPLDPAAAVLDATSVIRPDLPPGVILGTTYADDRPLLNADRAQIRDALLHLLTNACDAVATDGTIHIRVETGAPQTGRLPPDLDRTEFVVIEVEDNGKGIPKELLPRLYEPFFSTKERPGLGLASVYQTVKQHGGGVTVDSKPGTGSTFRLYLPAHDHSPEPPPLVTTQARKGPEPARVLVIDDDASVRRVVRQCLEREGMSVDEASCGEDGLDRHREHDPDYDVIVLDIIMPGMSGWDVLHQLRRSNDTTPVVLQSGFMTEVDHNAAQYASAFLRKPYDLADLTGAVKSALAAPAS